MPAMVVACAKPITVPKSDYDSISSGEAKLWRVKTKSGVLYSVHCFSTTDSSFVIESVKRVDGTDPDGTHFTYVDDSDLPLIVSYEEIEYIVGIYVTSERKLILLSAAVAAGGLFLMGMYMIALAR